jgi:hypothetical protein
MDWKSSGLYEKFSFSLSFLGKHEATFFDLVKILKKPFYIYYKFGFKNIDLSKKDEKDIE